MFVLAIVVAPVHILCYAKEDCTFRHQSLHLYIIVIFHPNYEDFLECCDIFSFHLSWKLKANSSFQLSATVYPWEVESRVAKYYLHPLRHGSSYIGSQDDDISVSDPNHPQPWNQL